MGEQYAFEEEISKGRAQLGMARFFSPKNLDRYRLLAGRPISPDQRLQILAALAGQMKALKAEMKRNPTGDTPQSV